MEQQTGFKSPSQERYASWTVTLNTIWSNGVNKFFTFLLFQHGEMCGAAKDTSSLLDYSNGQWPSENEVLRRNGCLQWARQAVHHLRNGARQPRSFSHGGIYWFCGDAKCVHIFLWTWHWKRILFSFPNASSSVGRVLWELSQMNCRPQQLLFSLFFCG